MNKEKDIVSLPTKEVLEAAAKEHPDVIILPLSQENLDELKKEAAEFRKQEDEDKKLPGMEATEETYQFSIKQRQREREWKDWIKELEYTPMKVVIQQWLSNLSTETRRNYAYYIDDMKRRGIMPDRDSNGNEYTVGHFRHERHELVLDWIKKITDWAEGTRQVRCACYISLTAYLERISRGWFRKVQPSLLAANPTFFQVHDKCVTEALTLSEWHRFIDALDAINTRDGLIARCMFQGAKRISEALDLALEQIDWSKSILRFIQKKTGGMIKEIPITYPQHFMDSLKNYIDSTAEQRKDATFVFITRTGKKVTRLRLNHSFAKASENAKIKKVSPHVLRATWVTLAKQQGIQDTDCMKVTGHTSSKMIYSYDKTSAEENVTKKLTII